MRKLIAVVVSFFVSSLFAEAPPTPPPLALQRTAAPIVVDGDLSDSGWKDAARIDQFYETSPGDNIPPKVKTVAWLTYDERYFYIGVRCDDPEPAKIRAPFVERDGVIGTDDNIAVFLDTRGDKRSALELRVSPRGIQADGFFDDAGPVEDFSPDYFYDTAAKIDASGWSAEFRIPFSSLRYSHADPQTWSIIVWRNYPRDFRYAFQSSPIPRGTNCYMCHLRELTGLTNLPSAGHFTAAPYVSSQRLQQASGTGSGLGDSSIDTNIGADVKWTPTATGAVDLTINPDFSQVEADVPQITVNQRFAVFFPEKRPFFLEGFDLFNTPLQVAYTRTITSPRAGVRSTGRIGNTGYTLLVADDRGGGLTILPGPLGSDFAPQDFRSIATIGRARHEMGSSFIGAVLTDREIRGGGHNSVLGPDFLWRPNETDAVTGQLLVSDTRNPNRPDLSSAWNGESLRSHAFRAAWDHRVQRYDYGARVDDIGDDFRADLGFVPQVGYREGFGYAGMSFYPQNSLFSFVRPNVAVDRQQDRDGETILQVIEPGVTVQGKKNLQAFTSLRIGEKNRIGNDFLSQNYWTYFLQFDPSRRFTRIRVNGRAGESIDFANQRLGRGASVNFTAIFRPIDRTTFEIDSNHEILNAGGGRVFNAQVERLRTLYSFTANSLVRVIAQYATVTRDPSRYSFPVPRHSGTFLGSVLYSYKLNWQTVLFAGYGDDRVLTTQNDLVKAGRSLFFKVSYAIQR